MGLYETRESHNRWLVRWLRDMLLATLCMAGYQPRVTSYWGSPFDPLAKHCGEPHPRYDPGDRAVMLREYGSMHGLLWQECRATGGGGSRHRPSA